MKKLSLLLAFVACVCIGCTQRSPIQRVDLSGTWKFAIDSLDKGIAETWFLSGLSDEITLPGSMASNGKGQDVNLATSWTGGVNDRSFFEDSLYAPYRKDDNFKIPFWLQPLKYYVGAAWYQKEIDIPADWDQQAIILHLERCHWETKLWINDQEVGTRNSLGTPHQYDLTSILKPGKNRITLRVDNRVHDINPGINSHSISDHTQGNWNGLVGDLYLEKRSPVRISHTAIYPDLKAGNIIVRTRVTNGTHQDTRCVLSFRTAGTSQTRELSFKPGENELETIIPLGADIQYWSEFNPHLYTLELTLSDAKNNKKIDVVTESYGMRTFVAEGRQLKINGQLVSLRGTLDCAVFPKTGYPPTDVESWLRIYNTCRAHGLNHVRFHSWCPPEAAFVAADQLGFYLEVECSSWANEGGVTIGDGAPIDGFIREEAHRMVEAYGNHPSFCMMMYGNEPAGGKQSEYLTDFVSYWKQHDNRRIYASAGGWPNLPVNEFMSDPSPRVQGWGQGLNSIINAQAPRTDYDWTEYISRFLQPVVSHEIGQWCVYPNFKEMAKYDGVYRARNFEIFQETLKQHGLLQLADSFLLASGKLQALCYKADIEAALRTKDFGGFQLLGLYDFPGQGTALVGVLDAFWEEKGYITPEEYSRFCSPTVPLARMKKLIYTNDETLTADIEVAHYGAAPLLNCTPEWTLSDTSGKKFASGKLPTVNIPLGNGISLGTLSVPLSKMVSPQQLKMEVCVGTSKNSWNIWVYPAQNLPKKASEDIRVIDHLTAEALEFLEKGGSALWTIKKGTLPDSMGGDIQVGFSSIFWNTAWTRGQAPHTLGILCNPSHPALADFPTEYHSDYQWWDAMSHSNAIQIGKLNPNIQPIVRVIDDWFTNRSLALLFEVKVGKGKLLISGIDFTQDMENRPEARQLLHSLTNYMSSAAFHPKTEVDKAGLALLHSGKE